MSPEQQRVKIAEACGWKRHRNGHFYLNPGPTDTPEDWCKSKDCRQKPPDFTGDLNAMHEAEKACFTAEENEGLAIDFAADWSNEERGEWMARKGVTRFREWWATLAKPDKDKLVNKTTEWKQIAEGVAA